MSYKTKTQRNAADLKQMNAQFERLLYGFGNFILEKRGLVKKRSRIKAWLGIKQKIKNPVTVDEMKEFISLLGVNNSKGK